MHYVVEIVSEEEDLCLNKQKKKKLNKSIFIFMNEFSFIFMEKLNISAFEVLPH